MVTATASATATATATATAGPAAGATRGARLRRGLVAGVLAALSACAPAAAPPREASAPPASKPAAAAPAAQPSIELDPAAEARIKGDVAYLASPELAGRGTGEPGAERAAEFIARQFSELGLQPLGGGSEGGGKAYLQAFDARVGADVAPATLAVQRAGRKQSVEAGKLVTADGSASGTVSGAAVLVGHGVTAAALSWDDYGGRDIEGKIAVVLDGVPTLEGGAPAAAQAGAAHGGAAHGGSARAAAQGGAAQGGGAGAAHGGAAQGGGAGAAHGGGAAQGGGAGAAHGGGGAAQGGGAGAAHGGGAAQGGGAGAAHGGGAAQGGGAGAAHGGGAAQGGGAGAAHGGGARVAAHGGAAHGSTAHTAPHHAPSPHPANALRDFGSVRYKLRTAREHKAVGVILVAAGDELPRVSDDAASMGIPAVVITRSAARALFPTAGLAPPAKPDAAKPAAAKPAAAKPAAAKPAAAKAPAPKPLDGVTVEITTKVTPRTAPASNVIGLLPARAGSPHAGEHVVVGAHYDHLGHGNDSYSRAPGVRAIHPGADDNASGTAMLLEVARRFAALPTRPDRNIVFVAFGAEELGTIGSRHFVDHPPAPLAGMKSIVAMINADMVGRMREDKLLVDGLGTSPDWRPIVDGAARGLGLTLQYGVEGFGASDHTSFTASRVPVAFLFTGVHEDYHRPSDTADKINAAGIARCSVLAARMALAIAQRDARLPFADAPADPHRSMRGGFRASLGTMPDYAYQGPGVKLTGVRPDAPASRAGMQAGDVIVRIGAHAITNIHDFMFALGDLEPGREVVIEVDRGGTRVPLKVIPAPGR
ncbi:M20/M25/M40 family metallo-hydrolase [Sorangium sp. So ce854]|uniref:M20/M25/M40 family metallo-hydrolase n=1 Tax=Sorangium sp. So ce854 TaxID=3133322 RepID=UPI003F63D880